jgi:hypothetical protein
VREYHRAHGICETDSRLILADLGRHMSIHRAMTGGPGLDAFFWPNFAFRGMIYHVGRLQFERVPIGSMSESMTALGFPCAATDSALSVHIPQYCGPFSPEAVDDALNRAVGFFARHFPSERHEYAVCHSWMLDPALEAYLPPRSNILAFQRRFTITHTTGNNETFQRFVFPGSRLRRAVEKRIEAGESWQAGSGFLRLQPA